MNTYGVGTSRISTVEFGPSVTAGAATSGGNSPACPRFSRTAREKIEGLGGTVQEIA